ncbi:ribonuclease P 40kDa subunit-domain-containing protein [Peziza echinospora]|nr:ribonuclease P 40kDa subunit-domain-containing protein [Peziza echinospora]
MVHSKCYVSIGREPKKIIRTHPFNKQVDFILPLEAYEQIKTELLATISPNGEPVMQYHRVRMTLAEILEKEFFNKYIKIGNVIMLSEGRIDTDDVYCLYDGKLRLSLTRESYERCGLVGKPAKFGGGRKGHRWNLEFDLRSDKMMHGTKQLERLIWSFTEVLTGPTTFLFCDLTQLKSYQPSSSKSTSSTSALASTTTPNQNCPILQKLKSIPRPLSPQIHISEDLIVPSMRCPEGLAPQGETEYSREAWREWAVDQLEWLGLVSLDADRIKAADTIDPYLSTYQVPEPLDTPMKIVRMRWRGLVPAQFIGDVWRRSRELLKSKNLPESVSWVALTAVGFENSPISWDKSEHGFLTGGENCYTILCTYLPKSGEEGGDHDGDAMDIDYSHGQQKAGREETVYMFEIVGSRDEHS